MIITCEDVDTVSIEPHRLKQTGYLDAMMQCLRQKHRVRLEQAGAQPIFYLQAGSKMNAPGFAEEPNSG